MQRRFGSRPGPAGTGRGRRWATAVVVVAALASAAACGPARPPAPVPASNGTVAAVPGVDGPPELVERSREAPVLGASVGAGGRSLELYAQPLGLDPVPAGELTASVEADATEVRVRVTRRSAADATTAPVVCRLAHELHVIRVPLAEPLGERPVVDVATGARLEPVVEAEILRPAPLPAGWRLLDEQPAREADRQTGWVQRYGPGEDLVGLTVSQRRLSAGPSERLAVGRAEQTALTVRGVPATWSRQANWSATGLVWTEGAWEVALGSSSPDGVTPALDLDAVVAFAASLTPAPPL